VFHRTPGRSIERPYFAADSRPGICPRSPAEVKADRRRDRR
jgi:hypothetical protein